MTWRETIARASAFLAQHGVPDAESAAEFLAARLLRTGRGTLAAAAEEQCQEKHLDAMRRAMKRLSAGEPLQYVLGEWDFRTLTLKCDRRALIPRPETEGLAGLALESLARCRSPRPALVDVCTGSGAIVLSVAAEHKGPAAFAGTDASADAISLARENARLCSLEDRVAFCEMDLLDGFDEPESIDIIVSNPPYIASAEIAALDPRVRDWEPRMALDGGPDGLAFYDRLLADALNLLKGGGRALFEIGDTQGEAVRHLFEAYGFDDIEIKKDLSGKDRYACGTLK